MTTATERALSWPTKLHAMAPSAAEYYISQQSDASLKTCATRLAQVQKMFDSCPVFGTLMRE